MTGSMTPVVAPGTAVGCVEYMTIADVRAEFGDDVVDLTDGQIQRKIDRLVGQLEENLGHTFGRAIVVTSSISETVQVTATGIVIGGDTYLFATYDQLAELVNAVNAAGDTYGMELLPQVNPATPSDILTTLAATACGPDYEDRVVLCIQNMWVQNSGDASPLTFLPLPIVGVTEVIENAVTLTTGQYWAVAGDVWLTRKQCNCTGLTTCRHPVGRWSNWYPGNIQVTYTPRWWLKPPASLKAALFEAFESQVGLGPFESENFEGSYSYKRAARTVNTPWDTLGGGSVRQYAIRFQP